MLNTTEQISYLLQIVYHVPLLCATKRNWHSDYYYAQKYRHSKSIFWPITIPRYCTINLYGTLLSGLTYFLVMDLFL